MTELSLFGDFNMNPFINGGHLVSRATMDQRSRWQGFSAPSRKREVYPFFYNPMWNHFGDTNGRVPGTYYYANADHAVYFWNMFDQVLIRPELIRRLADPGVRILTESGFTSFLSPLGRPNPSVASDHLPILFSLDLREA